MNEPGPKVSVVIPCFNHGEYLNEAVDSVLAQTFEDFEIIIVNDGSTDEQTNKVLAEYNRPKTRVIHTANHGLATARNTAIGEARGDYILPLDADDKIGPRYMERAVEVLDRDKQVGIVYCEAETFGEISVKCELPPFSFPEFLLTSMFFCSAFFRMEDYRKTKGYNPNMIYGGEDYDFWLSIFELGRTVHRLPETMFYYRQRSDSMVHRMTREQRIAAMVQRFENHRELYLANMDYVFSCIEDLREELRERRRELSFIKSRRLFKLLDRWWRLKERLGI